MTRMAKTNIWQLIPNNVNAHSLRGTNFFKGVLEYREKIWPLHQHRIKKPGEFRCVLCGKSKKDLYLTWKKKYELYQCQNCSAVSANITMPPTLLDDTYNTNIYFQKFKREILKHYEYRKQTQGQERYRYIVDRLKLNPKKIRVLDVGCGGGVFLSALKDRGVEAKGLEINPAQVRFCKSIGLDVSGTPLGEEEDRSYDVVTMFDVLEHLSDPIGTIRLAQKKLKPGGYLIAYTPNIHSLAYRLMGEKQNTLLPFEHFCFFNHKSFKYLARRSGFVPYTIEVKGFDVMDYLLMKEYEDGYPYTEKLEEFVNLVQTCVDHMEMGNHFRITFKRPRK